MPDVTPQSVYESLNAVRQQMADQQLAERRQLAAAEYARKMALAQQAPVEAAPAQPVAQPAVPVQPEQQQPQYLGDEWLARQAQIQKSKQYSYDKLANANLPPDIAKQYKEALDYKYDPTGKYSKPFEESALYKQAQAVASEKDTNSQRQMIDLLNKQVSSISSIGSPEDTPDQIRIKKTNAIKSLLTSLINSASGAPNAEQFSEFARKSPELMTYLEFASVYNKSLLDPKTWFAFSQSKEGENFVEKIAKSTETDPDAYLNKVKIIHNDLVDTWNQRMTDQVIIPTNPDTAKRLGVVLRPKLEVKQPEVSVAKPNQGATQAEPASGISRQQAAAAILQKRAEERANAQAKAQAFSGMQGF